MEMKNEKVTIFDFRDRILKRLKFYNEDLFRKYSDEKKKYQNTKWILDDLLFGMVDEPETVYRTVERHIKKILKDNEEKLKIIRTKIRENNVKDTADFEGYKLKIEMTYEYSEDTDSFLLDEIDTIKSENTIVEHWNVFDGGDVWNLKKGSKQELRKIKTQFNELNRGLRM